MSARLASLLLAPLLLAGCGGGFVIGDVDCDSEMAAITGELGFPEQIDRRFEAGIHIHTFLFLRSGLAVTFSWSGDLPCERRDSVIVR